jgi:hypothetical protein
LPAPDVKGIRCWWVSGNAREMWRKELETGDEHTRSHRGGDHHCDCGRSVAHQAAASASASGMRDNGCTAIRDRGSAILPTQHEHGIARGQSPAGEPGAVWLRGSAGTPT